MHHPRHNKKSPPFSRYQINTRGPSAPRVTHQRSARRRVPGAHRWRPLKNAADSAPLAAPGGPSIEGASKGGGAYRVLQFLFEELVLPVGECVRLVFGAQLRRQLVTLGLHAVQLEAQRRTQLPLRGRRRLQGEAGFKAEEQGVAMLLCKDTVSDGGFSTLQGRRFEFPQWEGRSFRFPAARPHRTSRTSCSSDNWRWRVSDSSTSLRWSSSSRWAERPRTSASSLRDASLCWLSAFSCARELCLSLAAWREREGGREGEGEGEREGNEEEAEDVVQKGAGTIRKSDRETEAEEHVRQRLAPIWRRRLPAPIRSGGPSAAGRLPLILRL
ncbi:hypothetical protein EYF80_043985 [Liparis tanakae]|uniref:Uncharacterized protein n=1 Tax=Liparis tanakae TaxID=230148 RepID=A0A4Z2FX43_9TELE|nr:hypothetical protein EYF80_043985 [Liparis tanakae]